MSTLLTAKDFSPYMGRWVVVTIRPRRKGVKSTVFWRVWVWGMSARLVYLANSPALSKVWSVPYEVLQQVLPLDAWPQAPAITEAPWFSTWDALYAIPDPSAESYSRDRDPGRRPRRAEQGGLL